MMMIVVMVIMMMMMIMMMIIMMMMVVIMIMMMIIIIIISIISSSHISVTVIQWLIHIYWVIPDLYDHNWDKLKACELWTQPARPSVACTSNSGKLGNFLSIFIFAGMRYSYRVFCYQFLIIHRLSTQYYVVQSFVSCLFTHEYSLSDIPLLATFIKYNITKLPIYDLKIQYW